MSLRNEKIFTNIFSSPTEGGGVNFLWKGWVESSQSFIALPEGFEFQRTSGTKQPTFTVM